MSFLQLRSKLRPVVLNIIAVVGGVSLIKTFFGLANSSTKTVNGLSNASVKSFNGLANV